MAQQRKEKTPSFDIYLMFSEGVQFSTPDIQAALLEDFPGLDISPKGGLDIPMACDTDDVIPMAPILMGSTGEDATLVNMMRLPGYGTWDHNAPAPRRRTLARLQARFTPCHGCRWFPATRSMMATRSAGRMAAKNIACDGRHKA
jgi:hypothetical protein